MTNWPAAYRRAGPPMPDLSRGLCVPGNSALPPEAWTADATPDQHEAALHACRACPVRQPCAEWAITSMPGLQSFRGVIGGMSGRSQVEAERRRRRAKPA